MRCNDTPPSGDLARARATRNPLRKLYYWTLHWAATPYALPALVVLSFVGMKMILTEWVKIPVGLSLGVIAAVLAVSIVASLALPHPVRMVIDDEAGKKENPVG